MMEFGESPKQTKVLVSPISHRTTFVTANITSIEDKQKTSLPKVEIILREWNCFAYPNDGFISELNSFVFPNTDLSMQYLVICCQDIKLH